MLNAIYLPVGTHIITYKSRQISLDELFAANEAPVYRFLLRLCSDPDLAGDLTQEALTVGWQRRDQLRNTAAFRTWLFRIAHNTFLEHLRSHRKRLGTEPLSESCLSGHTVSPEQLTSSQEMGRTVWLAMERLPPRRKQVLHLRVVEQLSTTEIGEILGISTQTVRSNLAAARKQLCQLLGDTVPVDSITAIKR